jgi:ribA/ribD-fused uncharacterized protein
MPNIDYATKTYRQENIISFCRTKDEYGYLSNMAAGYPITINGNTILTSEALYQACRFPDYPDIQREIIAAKSPMTAKMISRKYNDKTRADWEAVKVNIMYACILLKFLLTVGENRTFHNIPIVEISTKDSFWGAIPNKGEITGQNVLGQLLSQALLFLAETIFVRDGDICDEHLVPNKVKAEISKLNIPNFILFNQSII